MLSRVFVQFRPALCCPETVRNYRTANHMELDGTGTVVPKGLFH
jgi:hypothetical protein